MGPLNIDHVDVGKLSSSQQLILEGLLNGLCAKETAFALGIHYNTLRYHIAAAIKVTGARSKEQLIAAYAVAKERAWLAQERGEALAAYNQWAKGNEGASAQGR